MADIAALGISIKADGADKAAADLNKVSGAASRAQQATQGIAGSSVDASDRLRKLGQATAFLDGPLGGVASRFRALGSLINETSLGMAALAIGVGAVALVINRLGGALVELADSWSDMNARVGLAIRNMDASGVVMDRLADVARRTYSSLELTAESFIRNSTTLRELGKSTNQQLDYTEALNLALVVSGAKGDRARQIQEALARAMAGGALRGQELNTVIQNGGRVAELLAEKLGISVSQLRRLGEDGKITASIINDSLVEALEKLRAEAELMPATIGDAFIILRNSFLQLVGVYDQHNQLSASVANGVIALADNLENLARALGVVAVALAGAFSASLLAGIRSLTVAVAVGLVGAFNSLRLALVAHPILAFASVLATVAMAVYQFRDHLRNAEGPLKVLGDAVDVVTDKLYLLGDVWRATLIKVAGPEVNDDAMQATALAIAKLTTDLEEFTNARDLAIKGGADTTILDDAIFSIQTQLKTAKTEYWRMNEIRELAEKSFTEIVAIETEKRRKLWEWEKGTTVTRDFGLDQPGVAAAVDDETKAFKNRLEAIQKRVESVRIEAETYGMAADAAVRLRIQRELENEAIREGMELTAQRRLEILAEADAMAVATRNLQAITAARDLAFERDQMGRSEREQRVYSQLDSMGLLTNGQIVGEQAQMIANQIRFNEVMRISQDVSKEFASGFVMDIRNGISAVDALANAMNKLADRFLDMAMDQAFSQMFAPFSRGVAGGATAGFNAAQSSGGLFGGTILPGVLHNGGMVGNDNYPHRMVAASAFANARRYHNGGIAGLKPDEVPAILQRGERVLPKGRSGAGGVVVNITNNIDATGADAAQLARVERRLDDLPRQIVPMVADAMDRNVA